MKGAVQTPCVPQAWLGRTSRGPMNTRKTGFKVSLLAFRREAAVDTLKGREGISRGGLFISRVLGHRVRTQLRLPEHLGAALVGSC